MVAIQNVTVKEGDVLLMVGTMKGAFLLRSSRARARWEVAGPYFPGRAIYALAYDDRQGRHRLWAGVNSLHWGSTLCASDDFGKSWTKPEQADIKFPAGTGAALRQVWQISVGRLDEPDTLYCGVEPAALFESRDGGKTWSLVQSLYDHPHRPRWEPGGGGLALHTIVPDPVNRQRVFVAISTGGVYRTDDGGRTWRARNQGLRAEHLPDKYPEFGQCVHKVVQHRARPERLFLQNHGGLYRSDDAGDSWQDIANGVPSDFGFAMVIHPQDPDTVYILPLESDEFRCTPERKLRVYRTQDAGRSWKPLGRGLPQKGAFETVLRDAMASDTFDPVGIYFGTRSGKVYNSSDDGASWHMLMDGLPPVVCVKAAFIGDSAKARKRRATRVTYATPGTSRAKGK